MRGFMWLLLFVYFLFGSCINEREVLEKDLAALKGDGDISQSLSDLLNDINFTERDDDEDFYYGYDANDLAKMSGFMIQHYNVETEDGYILDLWRLNDAYDTLFSDELAERAPVIISPGLGCDGTIFMNNNRTNSVAYMMFDEGYDVWIINNRGDLYSRKHKTFSVDSEEFWDFTMYEQAKYDVVSSINFVLSKSNYDKVTLVGHSMGSANIVVLLSMHEEFGFDTSLINSVVLTAPATISEHMSALFLEKIHDMEDGEAEKIIFRIFGRKSFVDHDIFGLPLARLSYRLPDLAYEIVEWSCGEDSTHAYDGDDIYYYLNFYPSGTSVYSMAHYLQLIKRGGFQAYDYSFTDKSLNVKHYGSQVPPTYDLDKIPSNIPILIMPGGTDTMATLEDCKTLYNLLSEKQRVDLEMHVVEGYNHVDFMWGRNAGEVLYPKIKEFLEKYDPTI